MPLTPPVHPPPSPAALAALGAHRFFISFPIACFILALMTDVAYWRTSFLMWHDFSAWLLFAGLVGGLFAALAALTGVALGARSLSWAYGLGWAAVFVLAIVNSLYHAGDGWTAIVPTGLTLSAATVLAMLATVWAGGERVRAGGLRHA